MAPDEVLEPSPATAPILNMLSMEDYLAAYNNTIQTSPEKRQSIDRSRALSPSGGGFVATLHERLHALCIPPPEYEIEDDSKGNQRFRGRVFIDAVGLGEIELDGVYPSKKKVKEELAREALAALNQAEKEGLLNQAPTETTPYSPTKARTNSITEPRSISSLLPPSLNIPRPAPPPVPVPIALATSASTTNVTDLMHIIQKHGLPYALFTVIADPPSSSLFVGTTSLPGVVEEISTPPGKKFPSKKHAKEYLAGVCLEKVKEYVAQKQAREEESKKRKSDDPLSRTASSDSATVEGNNDTPTLPDNHYTGVLNCHLTNNKHVLPSYNEYQLGLQFSCELTLPPSYPCPPDMTFGSKTTPYRSKKQARNMAAKECFDYLVAQGHVNPKDIEANNYPKKRAKGDSGDIVLSGNFVVDSGIVARYLGYFDPQYIVDTDNHAVGICDVSALVRHQTTGEEIKFPMLRNQIGKKNARRAMAEVVLQNLVRMVEEKGGKVISPAA